MNNSLAKNVAYSLLNLITLKKGIPRKINNKTIRFPPKWSRYFPGDYEADNYSFLEHQVKSGMNIIDIGAHIGLFSVYTSKLTGPKGKVICFEPTPGTFTILKETLRLNHSENVTPVQAAVGATSGHATFYVTNDTEGSNSNSLVLNKEESRTDGYDVTITTIDEVCKQYNIKPGLIKVDVEGAELDTLRGGVTTMESARPLFIVGLHPSFIAMKGDSLKQIWDLIKQYNYKVICNDAEMNEQQFVSQDNLFDVQLLHNNY